MPRVTFWLAAVKCKMNKDISYCYVGAVVKGRGKRHRRSQKDEGKVTMLQRKKTEKTSLLKLKWQIINEIYKKVGVQDLSMYCAFRDLLMWLGRLFHITGAALNLFTTLHDGNFRRHSSMNVTIKWHKFSSNIYYIYVFFVIWSWELREQFQLQMTKNRTRTPVYLDPGMHPGLEVKGLKVLPPNPRSTFEGTVSKHIFPDLKRTHGDIRRNRLGCESWGNIADDTIHQRQRSITVIENNSHNHF